MRQKWLNWILHLTGIIHKKKEALIYATLFPSIGIALQIIFLEIFLFFVSTPFFLFIGEGFSLQKNKQERAVISYHLRRKFFNSILFLIIFIWLVKLALDVFFVPMPVISNINFVK